MRPAVVFADAEAAIVAVLRPAWEGRAEPFAPAKVGTDFPSARLVGDDTWIQVEQEPSDVSDYPVLERSQVRVVCHAARGARSNVKAMASLSQSFLHTYPGDADVAAIHIVGGRSDVIADPQNQNLMVWFLARVVMLARPLNT